MAMSSKIENISSAGTGYRAVRGEAMEWANGTQTDRRPTVVFIMRHSICAACHKKSALPFLKKAKIINGLK